MGEFHYQCSNRKWLMKIAWDFEIMKQFGYTKSCPQYMRDAIRRIGILLHTAAVNDSSDMYEAERRSGD